MTAGHPKFNSNHKRTHQAKGTKVNLARRTLRADRPYINRGVKANSSAQKGKYLFHMSAQDQKSIANTYYSKDPYNYETNKTRGVLNRAKNRELSEKKYLAHSQKVMRDIQDDNDSSNHNFRTEEYKARPFTTDNEGSTMIMQNNNFYNNQRCATRKQKVRLAGANTYHSNNNRQYKTERMSSVDTHQSRKPNFNQSSSKENEVKELKITDYLNGTSRVSRYIKKSKSRKHNMLRESYPKPKILSPFKKSLLNVAEIYSFVERQKTRENVNEADAEAIIIQEKGQVVLSSKLNEKQKWKRVMAYMKKNPKALVDALPDPEPMNQTMYYPVYDEIIDQENNDQNANLKSSHDTYGYENQEHDALTLNIQNNALIDNTQSIEQPKEGTLADEPTHTLPIDPHS